MLGRGPNLLNALSLYGLWAVECRSPLLCLCLGLLPPPTSPTQSGLGLDLVGQGGSYYWITNLFIYLRAGFEGGRDQKIAEEYYHKNKGVE